MKKLNSVFSEIKTPESWKENLYNRIQEEETDMNMKKIRPIRKIAAWAAAVAAVVTVSVVTAAATGIIDFGSILRSRYNDNISAEKIEKGDYQSLDASATSENFEFTAKAFMGDPEESYVLLEAKVKNPEFEAEKLGVSLYSLGENVSDIENYGLDTYESEAVVDEEGNKSFLFRVKTYPAWVQEATAEKTNLMLYINRITVKNGETEKVLNADLKILFKPEFTNDDTKNISIGKTFMLGGVKCRIDEVVTSDYGTKVRFSFTNKGKFYGIMNSWEAARDTAEKMMGVEIIAHSAIQARELVVRLHAERCVERAVFVEPHDLGGGAADVHAENDAHELPPFCRREKPQA